MKIWDTDPKSKEIVQTLTGHNGTILCMAYSKKSDTIFTGSTDKTLKIWKYSCLYPGKIKAENSFFIPGSSAIRPSVSLISKSWKFLFTRPLWTYMMAKSAILYFTWVTQWEIFTS